MLRLRKESVPCLCGCRLSRDRDSVWALIWHCSRCNEIRQICFTRLGKRDGFQEHDIYRETQPCLNCGCSLSHHYEWFPGGYGLLIFCLQCGERNWLAEGEKHQYFNPKDLVS